MENNNPTGIPVDTPLTNTGPSDIADTSEEILEIGIESQADLDNLGTPEDIALQADVLEQQILSNEANQINDLTTRTLEATDNAANNAVDASISQIEAQAGIQIQNAENLANVSRFNIESQESINAAQLEAADIQRQRAQEDLVLQTERAQEQRTQLVKQQERRVAAQRASAAVRAHMGGMSFSGAGQEYIARVAENAAIDMEATIQQFDNNSQDIITQLQRRRDDTQFDYINIIDAGERELRGLRLELENALNSVSGIVNLSEADKKVAIAEIQDTVTQRKLQIERDTANQMSDINQQRVASLKNYASTLKQRQSVFLQDLDSQIISGTFNTLSEGELQELSSKTGLSVANMKARANAVTSSGIANAITSSGRNYTPAQVQALTNQYNGYVSQGFTPSQALSFVSGSLKQADTNAFTNKVATGQFFNLSTSELQQLSQESGLSIADMQAQANLQVNQVFSEAILKLNPDASTSEINSLRAEYNSLIENGADTSSALSSLLPEFKRLAPSEQNDVLGISNLLKTTTTAGAAYSSQLGNGVQTGTGGAYDKNRGLDLDGQVGDPVFIPTNGKVTFAGTAGDFGKSVVVELPNGDKVRYSHLDEIYVKEGDSVSGNDVFGTLGNTGNVRDINGNIPSAEALSRGVGSHLDIVVQKSDGSYLNGTQVRSYLDSIQPSVTTNTTSTEGTTGVGVGLSNGRTALTAGGGTIGEVPSTTFSRSIDNRTGAQKTASAIINTLGAPKIATERAVDGLVNTAGGFVDGVFRFADSSSKFGAGVIEELVNGSN